MSSSTAVRARTNGRTRILSSVLALLQFSAAAVCVASALGHLDRRGILFDLMSHFRLQYAALLVVACAALLMLRSFKMGLIVAVVAATDLIAVAPYLLPRKVMRVADGSTSIRVLSQNVNTGNRRYAEVLALIEAQQPDLVLLMEVSPEWMAQLAPLAERYPYSCSSPRTDNFGIALWSRFELIETRIVPMTEARVPVIVTSVTTPGGLVRLIGAHLLPPVSGAYLAMRNEQLQLIARRVSERPDVPTIVAGDLNTTPWSSACRHLLRDGRLRDSAKGFGVQRTWPASLWPLRIPIDYVLVSAGITVVDRWVAEHVGSDHLGVMAELRVDARR